jgi:hypothetical protein
MVHLLRITPVIQKTQNLKTMSNQKVEVKALIFIRKEEELRVIHPRMRCLSSFYLFVVIIFHFQFRAQF